MTPMHIEIDLQDDDPADVGIGYGTAPISDPEAFVLRVGECRILLNDEQAEALYRAFIRHFRPALPLTRPLSPCP